MPSGMAVLMSVGRRWAHLYLHGPYSDIEDEANKTAIIQDKVRELKKKFQEDPDWFFFSGEQEKEDVELSIRVKTTNSTRFVKDLNKSKEFEVPTLFSEPFDFGSRKDLGNPIGLRFYRSWNYPTVESDVCEFHGHSDAPFKTMPIDESDPVGHFQRNQREDHESCYGEATEL